MAKRDRDVEIETGEPKKKRRKVPIEIAPIVRLIYGPSGLLESAVPSETRNQILEYLPVKNLGAYEEANSWYRRSSLCPPQSSQCCFAGITRRRASVS